MSNVLDWRTFFDDNGDFELATYLFQVNKNLMKYALDLGTLLSSDQARLRAYKERIKSHYKNAWLDIAQALEYLEIIVPCGCTTEFCRVCGGARYRLNSSLSPDELREIAVVVGENTDPKLQAKLEEGLLRAMDEIEKIK